MRDRNWQVGIFGTFDVENYGDLLFPLIAEAELGERLGPITLHRFSYNARTTPEWPYKVTSLTELPEIAGSLDAVLVGGGFIIRFDKEVAASYGPPVDTIHHPTGYWLTPALIALQHGIPLVWNSPGMHCNDIPPWAEPLVELAFTHSRYIGVRDPHSKATLMRLVDEAKIAVVPDTAFGIKRLIDRRRPSVELSRLRELSGLTDPYIILQANAGQDTFVSFIRKNARLFSSYRFLVLPIGPVLGDDESAIAEDLPGLVRLPEWPHPLLLAELIDQASAVIGHSYHLAITALSCGVPVFSPADLSIGKYASLSGFDTMHALPRQDESNPELFMTRLRKTSASPAAPAAVDRLKGHWDQIAGIIREGKTATRPAINRFWQSLPTLLEAAADSRNMLQAECAEKQNQITEQQTRIDELRKLVALARSEIVARDDRIARLERSPSMKVTAPLRVLMRQLKLLIGKQTAK